MHGGTLSVYSAGEGCGATFTLKLPMRVKSSGPPSLQSSGPVTAVPSRAHSPRSPVPRLDADLRADAEKDKDNEQDAYSISHAHKEEDQEKHTDAHNGHSKSPIPQEKDWGFDVVEASAHTPPASTTLLSPRSRMPGGGYTPRHPSVSGGLTPRHPHAAPDAPKYRFLVVDDSDLNRKMVARTLTKLGHTCAEADDGERAIALMKTMLQPQQPLQQQLGGVSPAAAAHTQMFDAILMDFVMVRNAECFFVLHRIYVQTVASHAPLTPPLTPLICFSALPALPLPPAARGGRPHCHPRHPSAGLHRPGLRHHGQRAAVRRGHLRGRGRGRGVPQAAGHGGAAGGGGGGARPPSEPASGDTTLRSRGTVPISATESGTGTVTDMSISTNGDALSRRSSKPVALPPLALSTNGGASVTPAN